MAVRLYELSRKYDISAKELIEIFRELGFEVKSNFSIVPREAIERFEKDREKRRAVAEKKKSIKKVIPINDESGDEDARRAEKISKLKQKIAARTAAQTKPVDKSPKRAMPEPVVPKEVVIDLKQMTPGDFAHVTHKPVTEVILLLLKQGIVATKNQFLPVESVKKAAELLGVTIRQPGKKARIAAEAPLKPPSVMQEGDWQPRIPVVCVIGHVDHGKTTLLDVIRKTRVAAREKGGITQHLGAYEVATKFGSIVFLDTPGHEAFSLIRVRGVKVADVAILVVAADDGVMPQTIEAIAHAKEADVQLMVAINKIDKVPKERIDAVKQQLAQYDVVAEEWGGSAVMVPISAKEGTGIDELLDVLVLQTQLMELQANISIAPHCFVLESHLQKGRGPVGTVICRHGILKVGDYFVSGNVHGRVSSLMNMFSESVQQVEPSIPVQVAGFSALPNVGELFEVVPKNRLKRIVAARQEQARSRVGATTGRYVLPLIIKASNVSSKEAVVASIEKITRAVGVNFSLVHSGVGDVAEGDVLLASQTNSIIYGLHVKTEANAYALMKKKNVVVKHFDIIYKLLEDLETEAEAARPIEMELKKIGEAEVIRIFHIKKVGSIAGSMVKDGKFTRKCFVEVYRNSAKVGEGTIDGLQREKKSVKEVAAGYECGFLVKGFNEWELGDRVFCYEKVRKA